MALLIFAWVCLSLAWISLVFCLVSLVFCLSSLRLRLWSLGLRRRPLARVVIPWPKTSALSLQRRPDNPAPGHHSRSPTTGKLSPFCSIERSRGNMTVWGSWGSPQTPSLAFSSLSLASRQEKFQALERECFDAGEETETGQRLPFPRCHGKDLCGL